MFYATVSGKTRLFSFRKISKLSFAIHNIDVPYNAKLRYIKVIKRINTPKVYSEPQTKLCRWNEAHDNLRLLLQ